MECKSPGRGKLSIEFSPAEIERLERLAGVVIGLNPETVPKVVEKVLKESLFADLVEE